MSIMKPVNFFFFSIFFIFSLSCNKIDNYEEPDSAIFGQLVDETTGEPLQSEQPNGFAIKLFEKNGRINSPIIFSGKPDGSFENSWLFRNEYKVLPAEGAFFPVDTVVVQVGGRTEVNFNVTPFLAVSNVSVQAAAASVTATYNIARERVADKIVERKTIVSDIPTVNNVVFVSKAESDLSGIPDEDVLSNSYTDVVTNLQPGKKYYVRVAVRTNNALNRYNYSKIFEVNIP